MKNGSVPVIANIENIKNDSPAVFAIGGVPFGRCGAKYEVLYRTENEIRRKNSKGSLQVEVLKIQGAFSIQLTHKRAGNQILS